MSERDHEVHQAWSASWAGYAAAGILFAWGISPVVRFIDPLALFAGTVGAGGVIITLYEAHLRAGRPALVILLLLVSIAFGAGGIYFLKPALDDAVTNAAGNAARCSTIQNDMLSAHPKRQDGPDLFQALGCQPRGTGIVYGVK